MKILFIGNSYTYYNDMPKLFSLLAEENGQTVSVDSVTKGGRKLIENLDFENDENSKKILELSKENKYDVLFLQEQSLLPIKDIKKFQIGADELTRLAMAKRNILYATWGRKSGCEVLTEMNLTSEEMTDKLYSAYESTAKSINAELSPVGLCFNHISQKHKNLELYAPDLSHPSYFGSALAAACHYKTIFGKAPEKFESLSLASDAILAICDALASIN